MNTVHSQEKWQKVDAGGSYQHSSGATTYLNSLFRLKIPGGWLLSFGSHIDGVVTAATFYPDPDHSWLRAIE